MDKLYNFEIPLSDYESGKSKPHTSMSLIRDKDTVDKK